VDGSPDSPGVYALLNGNGGVLYYGMSTISVRARLKSHLNGTEGRCTQAAAKYKREVTASSAAAAREEALLAAFKATYGSLPNCNRMAS
jgi:excinuclease UvrABC nuclease subunit